MHNLKIPEEAEQIQLVGYARMMWPWIMTMISPIKKLPGSKGAQINQWKRLKAMGYMTDTLDVFFMHPRGEFCGLVIEMKKAKGGKISDGQRVMKNRLIAEGYCAVICEGFHEARKVLDKYMSLERRGCAEKTASGLRQGVHL